MRWRTRVINIKRDETYRILENRGLTKAKVGGWRPQLDPLAISRVFQRPVFFLEGFPATNPIVIEPLPVLCFPVYPISVRKE